MQTFLPSLLARCLAIALLACGARASAAPVDFDIPAQPLPAALQAFGRQAAVEVLFPAAELRDRQSNEVRGTLEPLAALERLLENSGYTGRQTGPKNFVVASEASARPGSIEGVVRHGETGQGIEGARIQVVGIDRGATMDPRGRFLITQVPAGTQALDISADGMRTTRVTDVSVLPGSRQTLSVIEIPPVLQGAAQLLPYNVTANVANGLIELTAFEVTETRPLPFTTANLDLPRTREDSLPFTTFSGRDIEVSGAASVQEFLRERLPQNFTADIPSELDGLGTDQSMRIDRIDLRGWGATETVFLLNGRRMTPRYQGTNLDTANATPNLQGIPIGSIERIEILPSAGGAIYGANATGGVINIITRLDYHGGQITLNYETPDDAHAPRRGIDVTYNTPLREGLTLRLSAGYSDTEPLQSIVRADVSVARWRRLVLEREPSRLLSRTSLPPAGATPNIRSALTTAAANLFGPGTSNFTTIPAGYTSGGLPAFTPGVYNLDLAEGPSGSVLAAKESTFGIETENKIFNIGVDKSLGERWRLSLDYRYSRHDGRGRTPSTLLFSAAAANSSRPRVPAAAPTNPFGQDVVVQLVDPRLQRSELRNRPKNTNFEFTSTLRGRVGEWRGYFDFTYSHDRSIITNESFVEPYGGWTNAFLTGAYNPFVDLRVAAPASDDFYANYIALRGRFDSATRHYQSGAKIDGPLWTLPAGRIQLTGGLEWTRSDRYRSHSVSQYQDALTGEPQIPVGSTSEYSIAPNDALLRQFEFDTYAVFAETTIPLLSETQAVPFVRQLELGLSGRLGRDERNGFNAANESVEYVTKPELYALSMRYEPVEGVTLRASRSLGEKPPGMIQVTVSNPPTTSTTATDRLRNETITLGPTQYIIGGNPDLRPEGTTSTNIGIILKPKWARGFRLSVDYLESVRDDAIATGLTTQQIIDLEQDVPGRVQRGAPDGHPSGVGPITFVDRRNINFHRISSENVDFTLDKEFADVFGGRLLLSLTGTKRLSFEVQTTVTTAPEEQVGNPTALAARQIAWNANGQLRWEGRRYSFGWATRYFDDILAHPSDYLLQGSDRAEWKLNHDVFVSYRVPPRGDGRRLTWLLEGTSVTLGVKNLFDREPRFWADDTERGIAPYDSITGRSVWLQVRKTF